MMMDWEEEERIRQERREKRRRLHEKIAETSKPNFDKGQQTRNDGKKTSTEGSEAQASVQNSPDDGQSNSLNKQSKPKKQASKKKAKWQLPKLKAKRKSNTKNEPESNRRIAISDQAGTTNDKMPPTKKVHKKNANNWKKMTCLLLPFIIALLVAGYYASPFNHVASISVEGVEQADDVNLYPLKEGMSVTALKNTKGEVEQAIVNQNPSVKSATVNVSEWNKVAVNVSAYRQLGYIQIADFFYPLLENDEIIDTPLPSLEKDLPLFEDYDISDDQERAKLTETIKAFSNLSDDIIQKISLVSYKGDDSNNDRIALQMVDGNVVRGFISSIGDRMSYYNGIASQLDGQTGLIDMEVAIYFTELNDGNNPYASAEDKKAYEESVAAESSASSESEASALDVSSNNGSSSEADSSTESTTEQSASEISQVENAGTQADSSTVETEATTGNNSATTSSE